MNKPVLFLVTIASVITGLTSALLVTPPPHCLKVRHHHHQTQRLGRFSRSYSTSVDAVAAAGDAAGADGVMRSMEKEKETVGIANVNVNVNNVDTERVVPVHARLPPGQAENELFQCDDTVAFWRDFQRDGFFTAQENMQGIAKVASSFASLGPNGLNYWLRHVARTGYFATNAILGTVGFELHEALVGKNSNNEEDDRPPLVPRNEKVATRLLLEAALSYQQDYDRIVQQNMYKVPWDMMTTTDNNNGGKGKQKRHRQSSPIHVATQSARFVQEAIGTLGRRKRATPNDKQVWIFGDETTSTNQNDENSIYPDYYRTAFHYQTDGWMSTRSAQVYETSTESLFLGRQDAMQRTALPALMRAARDFSTRQKILQKKRPMRVLEVACGTGRFLTFVQDNLPPDTEYTAVDLSPYYLEAARENDAYYRKFTTDDAKNKNNVVKKPTTFLQARAEDLRQLKDESFDAVVCMYLFHELPTDIRQEVAAEMARVVVPGGTVVLTDSVQQGDRPILDAALPNFQHMNEPHYISYMQDNLPAHFQRAGLECSTKYSCSTTKSLSFTKPIKYSHDKVMV